MGTKYQGKGSRKKNLFISLHLTVAWRGNHGGWEWPGDKYLWDDQFYIRRFGCSYLNHNQSAINLQPYSHDPMSTRGGSLLEKFHNLPKQRHHLGVQVFKHMSLGEAFHMQTVLFPFKYFEQTLLYAD